MYLYSIQIDSTYTDQLFTQPVVPKRKCLVIIVVLLWCLRIFKLLNKMTSTFAEHHTSILYSPVSTPSTPTVVSKSPVPPTRQSQLDSLFLSLKPPLIPSQTRNALKVLASHDQLVLGKRAVNQGEEEVISAIIYKITVGLYAEVLDMYLTEATAADAEAEWWADIEHSTRNVAWYLLQSMPSF
jgi:nuclear control of ATPase protein 2